jgi:hypothetical protein
MIKRSEHYTVRPFYVRHRDEEIRVTLKTIAQHFKREHPLSMTFQRYIVGRPNLLKMPIYPVQEDKSLHWQAGANFMFNIKDLYVWCFNDTYPARLEVNCEDLSPAYPIKIGDIEKMLPYGMYLHKMYDHQKFHSVVKLNNTNVYVQRKNMIVEQADQIKDQRKRMQLAMVSERSRKDAGKKKAEKHVPEVVASAKFIMQEKKDSEKAKK